MYCRQSFAWSLQSSHWCSWCWCYGCNICWQSHCLGGRSWCRCSWCYITKVGCICFDSIWMTFLNVVISTSVLFTTNDLDRVGAIFWLCRWWWQGVTGSWHHWGQIQFGQQRVEVSSSSLIGHGILHSGWHIGWDTDVQHWHVGQCAWSAVAQWCVALTGITFPQVNASEHQLACYGMLVELSIGLKQRTWHGWAIPWWSWGLLQLDHWL